MASKKADNGTASAQPTPAGVNTETGEVAGQAPITRSAPPEMVRDQVELLKKLVAKDIVTKKDLKYTDDAPPRSLYTVFGVVTGTQSGESNYGGWLCFTGSFEAVRTKDRKRFASDKLFLQNPAEGMLLSQFAHMKKEDSGATLGFSFEIGVKVSQRFLDTTEGNSYEYTVKSVFKAKSHDPLAALREEVMPILPDMEVSAPVAIGHDG